MAGNVIQPLHASPLLASLTEAELNALAGCGRVHSYAPGEVILAVDGQDERLFVLRRGRVRLRLTMQTEGGQCSGETTRDLTLTGQTFGWGAWVRPEHIIVSALALEPVSLVACDLTRLKDAETFWKLSQQMLKDLYGWLQESGLCPPNLQALLGLSHLLAA